MTRLKFSFFFILTLAAICFCFYQISINNIEQSREETQNRLARARDVLQTAGEVEARLNVAAMTVAMRGEEAVSAIDELIAAAPESVEPSRLLRLRQVMGADLASLPFDPLAPRDLIFVQAGEKQHVIGGDLATSRTLGEKDARVDLEAARSAGGSYSHFDGRLYRLFAIEFTRPAPVPEPQPQPQPIADATEPSTETAADPATPTPADAPAPVADQAVAQVQPPVAEPAQPPQAPEIPVRMAFARVVDEESIQRLSSVAGVRLTFAVEDELFSTHHEEAQIEGERRVKVANLRASGPLPLKPFARIPALSRLPLPLFVDNPASHQALVIPMPGVESGRFILDTQMDGLLMLAYVQKHFLIGLLAFLVVGIVFIVIIGLGNGERAPVRREARVRKDPIAAQALSKSQFTRPTTTQSPIPVDEGAKIKKTTSAEMLLLNTPLPPESSLPKTLTPAEFNFGDSPLAEELSPQPKAPPADVPPPVPAADASEAEAAPLKELSPDEFDFGNSPLVDDLSPASKDAPRDVARVSASFGGEELVAEDHPHANEAHQAAAEDFAGYQYPGEPAPLAADELFDDEPEPQAQTASASAPAGLAATAPGYQLPDPSASETPASFEALYGAAAAEYEHEATRQMNLNTLAELKADSAQAYPEMIATIDPVEAHFRETYEQFVATRAQCGESTDALTYEGFALKLKSSRDQLMQKHGCASVRFQVYVKAGKAALKATPIHS